MGIFSMSQGTVHDYLSCSWDALLLKELLLTLQPGGPGARAAARLTPS